MGELADAVFGRPGELTRHEHALKTLLFNKNDLAVPGTWLLWIETWDMPANPFLKEMGSAERLLSKHIPFFDPFMSLLRNVYGDHSADDLLRRLRGFAALKGHPEWMLLPPDDVLWGPVSAGSAQAISNGVVPLPTGAERDNQAKEDEKRKKWEKEAWLRVQWFSEKDKGVDRQEFIKRYGLASTKDLNDMIARVNKRAVREGEKCHVKGPKVIESMARKHAESPADKPSDK